MLRAAGPPPSHPRPSRAAGGALRTARVATPAICWETASWNSATGTGPIDIAPCLFERGVGLRRRAGPATPTPAGCIGQCHVVGAAARAVHDADTRLGGAADEADQVRHRPASGGPNIRTGAPEMAKGESRPTTRMGSGGTDPGQRARVEHRCDEGRGAGRRTRDGQGAWGRARHQEQGPARSARRIASATTRGRAEAEAPQARRWPGLTGDTDHPSASVLHRAIEGTRATRPAARSTSPRLYRAACSRPRV